jgi:hypothetical protein
MDLKSQLLREEGAESCAYQDSLGYLRVTCTRLWNLRKNLLFLAYQPHRLSSKSAAV